VSDLSLEGKGALFKSGWGAAGPLPAGGADGADATGGAGMSLVGSGEVFCESVLIGLALDTLFVAYRVGVSGVVVMIEDATLPDDEAAAGADGPIINFLLVCVSTVGGPGSSIASWALIGR